jgi:chaperonin GroEL (HSP60 family)
MNKIIINQIEKLFVTKDASTIVKELSVEVILFWLSVIIVIL